MISPHLSRPARLLVLVCLLVPTAFAQEPTPVNNPPAAIAASLPADDKELHKVSGIFDTDLPKTEKKGRIRVIVHPHFGDFTRRSYVRIPLGVRVGVNDHVEFSAMVEPYIHHGLKGGSSGNGIGDLEFGAKYALRKWLKPDFDTSVGLNVRILVGHPPLDMTDGHHHYSPYLVVSRKSPAVKGLTWFVSPRLDVMEKSSVAGVFRKNATHSTSMIFGTGFVIDRYPWHYTLESGYQTTTLVGKDNKHFVYIRPGLAWDLPRKLTFNSRGRWLLGGSIKITQGPDGTRIDSGGKIRGEFSLTRLFRRDKTDSSRSK